MHNQSKKSGRPRTPQVTTNRILALARSGWARKAIAAECNVSDMTISNICHSAGFYFPRGGDRRSSIARAATREAPAQRYDRNLSIDDSYKWAGSAYQNGRLKRDLRGQRGLPSILHKKYDAEKGGFKKI